MKLIILTTGIILVSSEKKPFGVCSPRVKMNPNITDTKLQKLKHSDDSFFFSLEIFSVFDWIQIIVAAAGELRITVEPSHDTLNFGDITTKNEHSALFF